MNGIPIFFQKALGTLVRQGLTVLGTYLIAHGWATNGDVESAVMAITPLVISVVWGLYQKYGSTLMAEALRVLPAGASRTDAKADIAKMTLSEKVTTATSATAA